VHSDDTDGSLAISLIINVLIAIGDIECRRGNEGDAPDAGGSAVGPGEGGDADLSACGQVDVSACATDGDIENE
jgi:hypothetical protein